MPFKEMNFKQIPIIATPILIKDLAQVSKAIFSKRHLRDLFEEDLRRFFNSRYCHLTCSGTAAAYTIFSVLKDLSDRREVIIPAYLCRSVVTAINKAGLKVRLCDTSLDTFQMDVDLLEETVSDDTLCIVPVHFFGLACDVGRIARIGREKDIYIVEDFAQSMGTVINGKMSGTLSRIGFTSFARGKNLPTYSGGAVVTGDEKISGMIKKRMDELRYPSLKERIDVYVHLLMLSMIVNPYIHKIFHKLKPQLNGKNYLINDLESMQYAEFQAAVGRSILRRFNSYKEKRYKNGMFLYEKLEGFDFLRLPEILPNSTPAFNRFPVLFNEKKIREKAERELLKVGVTACRLYEAPIHMCYSDLWDGKGSDPYPNASKFCKNLTTVPVHPLVDEKVLERVVEVFKKI